MRTHLKLAGPFAAASASRAVRHNEQVYVSGLIGLGGDGEIVAGGVGAETRTALADGRDALEQLGASLDDVVSATVYLVDFDEDYPEFSRAYGEAFGEDYPARVSVGVSHLAMNARVEIQLVAIVDDRTKRG